jgi:type I restriction enzyme S subunit
MSFPRYPAYKDSGVEWLGEVPEHWELKKLKHCILRLGSGGTPESSNPEFWADHDSEGSIPWVAIGDMSAVLCVTSTAKSLSPLGLSSRSLEIFPSGSLLYSIYASLGKVAILGIDAAFNQAILAILPNTQSASQPFLRYWLESLERHLEYYASSNTQANLNAAKVLNYPVSVPSLCEQHAIATFLDRETAKIDALIAEQQRLIELLQEKRQAVISQAVTKGLNPGAPMKDSGVEWLGDVPEHWEVLPCRAILNERDERNNDYRSDYYLSLVAGRGVIPYDEKGDIGNKKPEDLGKCKHVREGDFVINSMNYGIGSYGVSRYDGVCSPVYIVVTPIEARTRPGFAFRVLENKWFQQYAQSFGNGILAHRCAIGWDVLKNIKAGLPPENEQLDILRYLDEQTSRFESLIAEAEKQVNLLKERRSALISAAVTGQIDVRGLAPETSAA